MSDVTVNSTRHYIFDDFLQIFILMFGLCFGYIGMLYLAKGVGLFLLVMALWGVFYVCGFLADRVGNHMIFSWLGLLGVLVALVLIKITPRKINVLKTLGGPKGTNI